MSDNFFGIRKGLNLAAQTSAPANPVNGDVYYDNTLGKFQFYEFGAWTAMGSGSSSVLSSASDPTINDDVNDGYTNYSLWINNTTDRLFYLKDNTLGAAIWLPLTAPDATASVKGIVKLAGDLGGTAALPTVPGLALKAPLASPALTGNPTAPTQSSNDNSTKLATTAYADAAATTAASAVTVVDATGSVKGKIKLAGDLSGTADLPTVPALIFKADLASPTFTGNPLAPTQAPLDNSTKIATTAYTDAAITAAVGIGGLTANVTILNNQTASLNTGIVFTYPTIKSFEVFAQIIRTTSTTSATEVTKILGVYDIILNQWVLTDTSAGTSGVEFNITAIGELQYKSSNLSGASYTGDMAYSYQANGGAISGTSPNDLSAEGLNYISKGNAEAGTTGWALYADAAATKPVDGTGGAANITFVESSVTPLRGLKSFILSKDAVNRQGQGVGYPFTIDNASLAKVLTIDFDYIINSGTFVAGSNTTLSDLIVYIYDVTNNVLIEPSSIKLLSNSATVADKFSTTFQSAYNSNSYRLIFHVSSTSALAYSLKIDNISIAPSKYVYGTPITDWTEFVPAISPISGFTLNQGWWRRVGSNMEVRYELLKNASVGVGATAVVWTIPNNNQIDTAKVPSLLSGTTTTVGHALTYKITNTTSFDRSVPSYIASATQIGLVQPGTGTSLIGTNFLAGCSVSLAITVPILGWSSSVQMSDSADTRICTFKTSNTNTAATTAGNPINSPAVDFDTHGGYSTSTGRYTVQVAGIYEFKAYINNIATIAYSLYKNGSNFIPLFTTAANGTGSGFALVNAVAGDIFDVRSATGTMVAGNPFNFSGIRVTGPSAIAASELVSARAVSTSGQSFANTVVSIVLWNSKTFDSHGAYNTGTGVFTIPTSGKYLIHGQISFNSGADPVGTAFGLSIDKNGALQKQSDYRSETATNITIKQVQVTDILDLVAGDTITFSGVQNSGGARVLNTSLGYNSFAITRL